MGVTCTHRLRFVRSLSALNHNNTSLICGGVTLKDDIDSLAGVPNLIAQLVASGAISPASQSTVQQFLDILFEIMNGGRTRTLPLGSTLHHACKYNANQIYTFTQMRLRSIRPYGNN